MKILTTVVLIILLLSVASAIYAYNAKPEYIEFDGVKIRYSDYLAAKELFKDRLYFKVCSLKTGECIRFDNFENYNELQEQLDG